MKKMPHHTDLKIRPKMNRHTVICSGYFVPEHHPQDINFFDLKQKGGSWAWPTSLSPNDGLTNED